MSNLVKVSSSNLPTEYGDYVIHIYKDLITNTEHAALVMSKVDLQQNILTRVHSECLTGDVFSSKRCDCGEQLKLAQQLIAKAKAGVIIYLRDHEGRGIGLANKIKAYDLQDQGLDTVEANVALGLPIDKRSFEAAAEILLALQVNSIRLMSNNPNKLESLEKFGITVNSLVPLSIKPNEVNRYYLKTKQIKLGHILGS